MPLIVSKSPLFNRKCTLIIHLFHVKLFNNISFIEEAKVKFICKIMKSMLGIASSIGLCYHNHFALGEQNWNLWRSFSQIIACAGVWSNTGSIIIVHRMMSILGRPLMQDIRCSLWCMRNSSKRNYAVQIRVTKLLISTYRNILDKLIKQGI